MAIYYSPFTSPLVPEREQYKLDRCVLERGFLIDVRNDAPSNNLAVSIPIFAILFAALLLISKLAMNQKDSKVDRVEVREWTCETYTIRVVSN